MHLIYVLYLKNTLHIQITYTCCRLHLYIAYMCHIMCVLSKKYILTYMCYIQKHITYTDYIYALNITFIQYICVSYYVCSFKKNILTYMCYIQKHISYIDTYTCCTLHLYSTYMCHIMCVLSKKYILTYMCHIQKHISFIHYIHVLHITIYVLYSKTHFIYTLRIRVTHYIYTLRLCDNKNKNVFCMNMKLDFGTCLSQNIKNCIQQIGVVGVGRRNLF